MLELPYRKLALCTGVALFFFFTLLLFSPELPHRKIALCTGAKFSKIALYSDCV
jgi:hypothetical protein